MKGESDVEKDQDKKNQPASKRKCKDQREVKTLRHCLATRSPASLIREDSWSWNIALDNQSVGLWTLCKVVVDFFEILHLATNLGCWDLPGELAQYSQIKRLNYTYSCFFKLALFSSHLPLLLLLASVFISRLSPSPPFSSVTYVEGWLFLWSPPLFHLEHRAVSRMPVPVDQPVRPFTLAEKMNNLLTSLKTVQSWFPRAALI